MGVRVAGRKNVRVLGRGKRGKGEGLVHLESRWGVRMLGKGGEGEE